MEGKERGRGGRGRSMNLSFLNRPSSGRMDPSLAATKNNEIVLGYQGLYASSTIADCQLLPILTRTLLLSVPKVPAPGLQIL